MLEIHNCLIVIVSQISWNRRSLKLNEYSLKLAPLEFWINFSVDEFPQISRVFDKFTQVYPHKH